MMLILFFGNDTIRTLGPEVESRWGGEIFPTCPDWPWGPPNLLYNGDRVFPGSKERPGRDADPSPLLVPWSWKGRATPLLPQWAVRPVQSLSACTRVQFTIFYRTDIGCCRRFWGAFCLHLQGGRVNHNDHQLPSSLLIFHSQICLLFHPEDGSNRPSLQHCGNTSTFHKAAPTKTTINTNTHPSYHLINNTNNKNKTQFINPFFSNAVFFCYIPFE